MDGECKIETWPHCRRGKSPTSTIERRVPGAATETESDHKRSGGRNRRRWGLPNGEGVRKSNRSAKMSRKNKECHQGRKWRRKLSSSADMRKVDGVAVGRKAYFVSKLTPKERSGCEGVFLQTARTWNSLESRHFNAFTGSHETRMRLSS